jgi:hypothetical protein
MSPIRSMLEREVTRIERAEGFGVGTVGWTAAATLTGDRLDPTGSSAARGEMIPKLTICNEIANVHTAILNMVFLTRL